MLMLLEAFLCPVWEKGGPQRRKGFILRVSDEREERGRHFRGVWIKEIKRVCGIRASDVVVRGGKRRIEIKSLALICSRSAGMGRELRRDLMRGLILKLVLGDLRQQVLKKLILKGLMKISVGDDIRRV